MGREIRDLCEAEPLIRLALVADTEEDAGTITKEEGEPAVVGRLDPVNIGDADVAFLAGSRESAALAIGFGLDTTLIDLTYAAEENPRGRLRAPMIEPASFVAPSDAIHVIAHPAAIALGLILNRVQEDFPVSRAVAHVFEPASERGRRGIEELQHQAVNLLSFKGLPKNVYDSQVAFNLVTQFGEEAPERLETFELRIERHLASLLAQSSQAPLPSIRLIQAPVFHGHSISLWIECEEEPRIVELEELLSAPNIDVRGADTEPPDIVGVSGQGGIAVGAVSIDRNNPRAFWGWIAADNIRLMAQNALLVAKEAL